jgi:hypothetical protein
MCWVVVGQNAQRICEAACRIQSGGGSLASAHENCCDMVCDERVLRCAGLEWDRTPRATARLRTWYSRGGNSTRQQVGLST